MKVTAIHAMPLTSGSGTPGNGGIVPPWLLEPVFRILPMPDNWSDREEAAVEGDLSARS
jgi:hypothetical protein